MQIGHRRASDRRRRHGRSIAARAHAAFDADSLSRALRSRPRTVRRATGSDVARTDRERVLLQFRQRPLRALLRDRLRKDRDAIPERSLRALRRVRRPPFPAARAESPTARQIDSRRARVDRHAKRSSSSRKSANRKRCPIRSTCSMKSGSVICDSASRSTRFPAANPATEAGQASGGHRASESERRIGQRQSVYLRRADDRTAFRRCRDAGAAISTAGRSTAIPSS